MVIIGIINELDNLGVVPTCDNWSLEGGFAGCYSVSILVWSV